MGLENDLLAIRLLVVLSIQISQPDLIVVEAYLTVTAGRSFFNLIPTTGS